MDVPLSTLIIALVAILLVSALFSMAETSMMAANRHRLKHKARRGERGAKLAIALIGRTDKMLGVILLGNNLLNAGAATLVGIITIQLFGEDKWALGIGTLLVTFAILVFSEITPKIIGATHADRLAPALSFALSPLLTLSYPVVWFVNLFASGLLKLLRLQPKGYGETTSLTPEEIRSLVLEAGHILPQKHQLLLLNLFELGQVTVEDVMTPRGAIEWINLDSDWTELTARLGSSRHTQLLACRGDLDNVVGTLHLRKIAGCLNDSEWTLSDLEEILQQPYFVPASTAVLSQLQFFQENRQRMGVVVDEYGEVQGLVTPEDIIEEIVGEFAGQTPDRQNDLAWDEDGSLLVEGYRSLRDLNRKLGLDFPLDGPKTLSGLVIEEFQDIPDGGASLRIGDIPVEIVQTQDRTVKTVRIFKPLHKESRP